LPTVVTSPSGDFSILDVGRLTAGAVVALGAGHAVFTWSPVLARAAVATVAARATVVAVPARGPLAALFALVAAALATLRVALALSFSVMSSPVSWSTTFMERRTLPRSSAPRNFTFTLSPSLTTSGHLLDARAASSEMWTRPSFGPKKFTKAPNSIVLTTVPS
jgi:hypothetical protein